MEKDNCFIKWENWTAMCKIMKLEHSLTSCTKINPKWIKDLNVRLDIIKLIEKNIGRTLFDINLSNIFLDPSSRVTELKAKINMTASSQEESSPQKLNLLAPGSWTFRTPEL